jgi:hypothetical protein
MTPRARTPPEGYDQKVPDWPPESLVAGRTAQYDCPRCGPAASKLCYRCTSCQRDLAEADE